MIGIEVTREDGTWLLEDRDTVLRMARIGQLGPADTVREDREAPWAPAGELDWLASAFEGDPWDAWEELDGQDPEAAWADAAVPVEEDEEPVEDTDVTTREEAERMRRAARPAPKPKKPSPKMSLSFKPAANKGPKKPAAPAPTPRTAPPRKRTSPQAPQPPAAMSTGAQAGSMGQVIEFPNARASTSRGAVTGSEVPAALLQPLEVQDLVPNASDAVRVHSAPPPEAPRSAGPWLAGLALGIGLAAFGLGLWSIQRDAQWTSTQAAPTTPAPAVVETPPAEPVVPIEEPQPPAIDEGDLVAELEVLADELRERIPASPVELGGGPDDLASALLLELSNMKLGPVKVSAPVVSWTGAQNDVVEVADIEVRLTTSGSIERELGAVGLVVGKYLQHYGFEVRNFAVVVTGEDGVSRKRQIEPTAARHLWSGRKDLYAFLTGR